MVLGVDEDSIVRAGSHASLASNADRLIEIDYSIRTLEHCRRGTGSHTRGKLALIAPSNLMGPTHLRKDAHLDVFYVGPRNRKRNKIFRLAGRSASMATDAAGVIDHLGPFHVTRLGLKHEKSSSPAVWVNSDYITRAEKQKNSSSNCP